VFTADRAGWKESTVAGLLTANEGRLMIVFGGSALPTGAVCTLGFVTTKPGFEDSDLELMKTQLTAVHQASSCEEVALRTLELKVGPEETGPTRSISVNSVGGQGSGASPPHTCVLVQKKIAGKSARYAGRLFWPGVKEAYVGSSGLLQDTYMDGMQAKWDTLKSTLDAAELFVSVFHPAATVPEEATQISNFQISPTVATQRRRLRR
jgi:hypothetical protein